MRRVLDILPMQAPTLRRVPRGKEVGYEWLEELLEDIPCAAFKLEINQDFFLVGFCGDSAWYKEDTQLNMLRWTADGDPIGGRVIVVRELRNVSGKLLPILDRDAELIAFRPVMATMLSMGQAILVSKTVPSRILLPVRRK